MLAGVNIDELRHALGGVVLEAAYLERVLRMSFSALVGSKYAAVVDGRLTAASLITDCEQLTKYRTGLPDPAKQAVLAALRACHEASRERNRVIHDTWATRPGSVTVTLPGDGTTHEVTVAAKTLTEVQELTSRVAAAADALEAAMTAALGPGWEQLENQLREELGHEASFGPAETAGR
jgi:hypothetical protein